MLAEQPRPPARRSRRPTVLSGALPTIAGLRRSKQSFPATLVAPPVLCYPSSETRGRPEGFVTGDSVRHPVSVAASTLAG